MKTRLSQQANAPRTGANAPIVGAHVSGGRIAAALFGRTRRAVLAHFFLHPGQACYLRQLVRTLGLGQGAVQRELAALVEAGLLLRTLDGNQVHYRANTAAPVFPEIKSLMAKTSGIADVLRDALASFAGAIRVAFIHGSFARGTERTDSDMDVIVIGAVSFREVAVALHHAQDAIGREVNPVVYPEREFRAKVKARHHFLTSVLAAPRVFLMGDEHELERLGA